LTDVSGYTDIEFRQCAGLLDLEYWRRRQPPVAALPGRSSLTWTAGASRAVLSFLQIAVGWHEKKNRRMGWSGKIKQGTPSEIEQY
jgi:hypothetical protein